MCRCRRKYFSSLERLQIQQQSVDEREPTSGRSSQASSSSKAHRPSLSLGTGRRKRKEDKAVQDQYAFHVDLDFYLALPEKVRKQHFSREEEQVLLQRSRQTNDQESEWAQQRFDDFHFDFSGSAAINVPDRGRSRSRSSASSSAISPTRTAFAFGPSAEQQDRPSNPLYLEMMGTPIFTLRETPTTDVRRTMSLTTNPLLRHGASASLTMADLPPPSAAGTERLHQRAHSSSFSARRMSHTPIPPVFDPEATYYQDPEARKKLRMYLASPQKFDEAIEFGFPSTSGSEGVTPHYQLPQITSHARKFSRDMHTFLRDGHLSFFDTSNENQGLESDDDSVADVNSPATPSSTNLSFRLHSRQFSTRKHSVESPTPSPVSVHGQLNREMTLRMTLTRPDLRADEDQLYGWQTSSSSPPSSAASPSNTKAAAAAPAPKDDPLALEDLVFSDDMTGTKGAFYIKPKPRGNLVTRMLKRASLKGR
ncbi:mucin [Pyrenophora seminiperda CCB06]|uniref:Mucin n=1 Tax=Pyrenophora seminiperda CCB06 TaxID=1302712 RepID=A0A3M7LXP5_9PLEO|nr:mucin [Pyrenophora seminiperda CCB06]